MHCQLTAQTRALGMIAGTVKDSSGAVLTSAHVTATNVDKGWKLSTSTDEQGRFHFDGLPLTGSYKLFVSKSGFAPAETDSLLLRAGIVANVQVILKVAGQDTAVEVTGTIDSVNTSTPQLGTTLDQKQVDEIPVVGRKISTLALTDSMVRPARGTGDLFLGTTLFVVGDGGRRQVTYSVDNGTANDSWGRQALFTALPFAAVQEFSVLPNAFSAEYGRTSGSAINIVTKSGTNLWHGDFGTLWRPSALQANAPLAIGRATDRLAQGNATLSGPILRDHTFFLVSNEYNAQDRDTVITSPLAPGIHTGNLRQDLFFARIDQHWNDRHSSFLRANFDRLEDTNPADSVGGLNLPSAARTFQRDTYGAMLGDTLAITPNLLNEARLQFQLGSPITRFTPAIPGTQYVRPGLGTEGESRSGSLSNHQYEAADTLSLIRGRHSLRFGADVLYSRSGGYGQEFGGGFVLGQFVLKPGITTPIAQLIPDDVQRYTQSFGNQSYHVSEALIGAFVQDTIRWTPRLTLNAGLRYDKQTFTDSTLDFSPRLGFTYQLPFATPTVIRGSFGIFYSEIRTDLAAGYDLNGPEGVFTFSAAPGQYGFPENMQPLTELPAGAVLPPRDITIPVGDRAYVSHFLDVSKLRFYPDGLLNPYTEQWSFGVERQLSHGTVLSLDYLGQNSLRIERPVDLNAPDPLPVGAGPRSSAQADLTRPIVPVPNGYRRVIAYINGGNASYNGFTAKLTKRFSNRFGGLLSYTWSHAINTVEPDVPQQDPADSNFYGAAEKATSLLDQRHRVSASGWYVLPHGFTFGTWITAASGRPFNVTASTDYNGDGSFADRPIIDGIMVPRNWGRGTPTYDISGFVEKSLRLTERATIKLRGEGFNLTNNANIVGRNGVYCDTSAPNCAFGKALGGINNVDPGRQFQLEARFLF